MVVMSTADKQKREEEERALLEQEREMFMKEKSDAAKDK